MANAYLDCVPIIALGGSASLRSHDTDAFQEYDQLAMARPVTRWAARVNHTDRLPEYFNMARRKAITGKPGPTYLDLPGEVLYGRVEQESVWFPKGGTPAPRPYPDEGEIERAIELLSKAERPVVIAGSGVFWSAAGDQLREFVEATQIPFFTTPQARGIVPEDHDLAYLGARGQAFREADVIVVVGTRFNFIISFGHAPRFAPDVKVIHIDVDASELGHNRPVDVPIAADARVALTKLTAAAKEAGIGTSDNWRAQLAELDDRKREQSRMSAESDQTPIHPLRVAEEIVNFVDRDAIISVDGMETLNFGRQWIPSFVEGARLNSGPNGCMGVGIPFAMGAQVAAPGRQVVAFVGDGSFLMNIQEFDTMVRHNLPVIAVVSNNGGWTGGDNTTPGRSLGFGQQYHKVVEALGGYGELVTDPNDLHNALERAAESGKPSCINVHVEEHARATTVAFGGYSTMMSRSDS
jgi:thiamine pyrophosphate-dependent acetolactate synthase large subunit-like protein